MRSVTALLTNTDKTRFVISSPCVIPKTTQSVKCFATLINFSR